MPKTNFTVKRETLEVAMDRVFDAPAAALWKAFTDPQFIVQWWGPRNMTTTIDKMDVKEGGQWRYIQRDPQGKDYAFHGVYEEIEEPRLLSNTFNFEGIPGNHEMYETVTLEEINGQTRAASTAHYANLEDLDGMLHSGMESGAVESWDRLAELVER